MTRRTDTRNTQSFTLPSPAIAIFDFDTPPSTSLVRAIYITVPAQSTWRMPYHRHPSEARGSGGPSACHSVTCLAGSLYIRMGNGIHDWNRSGGQGLGKIFEPGMWAAWSRQRQNRPPQDPLKVAFIAEHLLWRNICSATLDRDLYPSLTTTPLWIKGSFALLSFFPSWREKVLDAMLWIQLQTIFYAHDLHLYHGQIPFVKLAMFPWIWPDRPPPWAERLQIRSMCVISRVVMTCTYWFGRIMLGMMGEYKDYSPRHEPVAEKSDG